MIRRDVTLPSGQPGWALIAQPEHARLSGVLAEHLSDLPVDAADRATFIAAVHHHDDGWGTWINRPKLDANGRPVSFMEMELGDSLAIWSDSIAAAERIGPLAAWLVAGHFAWLLRDSESNSGQPAAAAWLERVAVDQGEWLQAWGGAESFARQLLERLRTLDVASLWLCGAAPAAGESVRAVEPLETDQIRLVPVSPGVVDTSPGQFIGLPLDLTARASVVPRRRYADPADLLAAATPCELRWRLE